MSKPKILVYDIETSPMITYVWRMWDEVVATNQIKNDWHVMSWAAKWLGDPPSKIMYMDQRRAAKIEDDRATMKGLWNLIEEADIVVTHNGKSFDQKKINSRFFAHKLMPSKAVRHIDTYLIAKKHFGFTSNKLDYLAEKFCLKYKKYKHSRFSGIELWKECMKGNKEAWQEMEKYNKQDVLVLEELYKQMQPWDNGLNFKAMGQMCGCGINATVKKNGIMYTNGGSYQRYRCSVCGHESRDTKRMSSSTRTNISR